MLTDEVNSFLLIVTPERDFTCTRKLERCSVKLPSKYHVGASSCEL